MPYIHFTDEQKLRANSVDLVEFLRRQGEKLIPSGRDKRLASDHSITVRGNEWYDHEAEEGGGPISFVQTFYGLSYPEAVTRLLGGEKGEVYQPAQKKEREEPKEFALPPANQTMRRVYAYLLQQRHISREILNAFAQKGLIYESRELSKDKTKEYHNAVFVGIDEHGVARHAHKRGIYTQGKSYRGNVEGCDPRHSFHWTGTSDRLYVFEAPIDLLAFLTLYPEDWQQHSYVALCGTAEHAMLWMLEQNPKLQKIILCLDHDAAGIEAAGRLTDILCKHGYTQSAPLRSTNKDWDEDLKEQHGLEPQPPEEHPQLIVAGTICERIGAKCKAVRPEQASYQIPRLLQQYQNDLHWGRFEQAMDHMETMSALALSVVLRECRQMGTVLTEEQGARFLQSHIHPHQNRGSLKTRTTEIGMEFQSVLAKMLWKAFVLKWSRKPLPVHGWNLQSPVQKCRSNIVQMNFVDSKKRKKLCWKPHKPWHRTKTAKRRTGLNPFLLFIAAACGTVDKFRLFVFSSQAGLPLPAVRTLLRQFRCVKQIVAVVTRANQINHLDMFSL